MPSDIVCHTPTSIHSIDGRSSLQADYSDESSGTQPVHHVYPLAVVHSPILETVDDKSTSRNHDLAYGPIALDTPKSNLEAAFALIGDGGFATSHFSLTLLLEKTPTLLVSPTQIFIPFPPVVEESSVNLPLFHRYIDTVANKLHTPESESIELYYTFTFEGEYWRVAVAVKKPSLIARLLEYSATIHYHLDSEHQLRSLVQDIFPTFIVHRLHEGYEGQLSSVDFASICLVLYLAAISYDRTRAW